MKTTIQRFVLALLMASMSVGCATAYDAYGYPRPVVDPGVALLGAAAAGLAGYSIGRHRSHHHHGGHHYARYGGHHGYGHRGYYY
jgi:hypothetical protein